MLSNLECSILKELDRQNIKSDVISVVMNRLDTNDKKNDFLSFWFPPYAFLYLYNTTLCLQIQYLLSTKSTFI